MKLATLFATLLVIPVIGLCDTVHVPGDYQTIQEAIDAANSQGDTVLVGSGIYFENIDFIGKDITVKSADGPDVTVIDGQRKGSVVTFVSAEGPDAILEGFTITNGTGSPSSNPYADTVGGGILVRYSSPVIKRNIIKWNNADAGAGIIISFEDASPQVMDNVICENYAYVFAGGVCCTYSAVPFISGNKIFRNEAVYWGGGIGVYYSAAPFIENNLIQENWAAQLGGGIDCYIWEGDPATVTILNNVIQNNWTDLVPTKTGGGGGIECAEYDAIIAGNLIINNSCNYGGGIECHLGATATLINNTFSGNYAGVNGGGILVVEADMVIVNTIVADNQSPVGGEMAIGGEVPSFVSASYSNILGGMSNVVVDVGSVLELGDGMVYSHPYFVDKAVDDFHLYYYSPCLDTGDETVTGLPDLDFEGDPRVAQGCVDMGADEFYTHLYVTGDFTPGGYIQGKFVDSPGTTPVALFIGSGVKDPPLHHKWGDFYLQPPWLLIPLVPISSDGVLAIPTFIPATPPAPYDLPMQALIGERFTNLFVMEVR